MKKILILMFVLFTTLTLFATVQYRVDLLDSYGDGWNGGLLDVVVNGTVVLDSLTLASGTGPEPYYFDVNAGDEITTVYTAGNWSSENSYYIYDSLGNEVGSDGVGGTTPVGITTPIVVVEPSGNQPVAVSNPNPADGATNVSINPTLTWDFGEFTETYDLYFGTENPPTTLVVADGTADTGIFTPEELANSTQYFWKVVSKNSDRNETEGPVWSFTTELPADMVQIGNGTATNKHLPIEPYYGYTYSQSIYLASDFGEVADNQRISKIYYNYHWNSNGDADADDWTIYMGTTALTAIDSVWTPIDGMMQVFSGSVGLSAVENGDGWLEITLTTPFNYNPADGNLIIAVDENTPNYTSGSDEFYCSEDTRANMSRYYYSDSTNLDPADPTMAGTESAFYPNMRFTFEEIPATPQFAVSPESFDFGQINVGSVSEAQTFTIANNGAGTLTINSVALDNEANFVLTDGNTYPIDLTDNTLTVDVTFVPTDSIAYTANLIITDNQREEHLVPLSGLGYIPPVGDTIENPFGVTLTEGQFVDTGSTVEMNNDYPYGGGNDVIYHLILDEAMVVGVSLENSAFDTKLAIYNDTETVLDQANALYFNDDYSFGKGNVIPPENKDAADSRSLQSAIFGMELDAGGYWVLVDGYSSSAMGDYNIQINAFVPVILNPPQNLIADAEDGNVTLNWEAPAERDLLGYKVYKNGAEIANIDDTTVLTYSDMDLPNGVYTYYVTAIYDEGESEPSNTAEVIIDIASLNPPQNLSATVDGQSVILNWDAPAVDDEMTEFRWDDGVATAQLGFGANPSAVLGSSHMNNAIVNEVSWYLTSNATHPEAVIYLFGLDETGMPDVNQLLFESDPLTNVDDQWNTYTLPAPVAAPNGFFVGVCTPNVFTALATDDGVDEPYVFQAGTQWGIGDWTDGSNGWLDIGDAGFPLNFLIRAQGTDFGALDRNTNLALSHKINNSDLNAGSILNHKVVTGTPSWNNTNNFRDLTGYRIYRNNEEIAVINDLVNLEYVDANLDFGTYAYYVTAIYDEGESEPSNTADVNIAGSIPGDTIVDPFGVTFDNGQFVSAGSTTNMNDDYDIPGSDNNDVVYQFTLAEDAIVDISLLGSDYDTKLAIYADGTGDEGWVPGPDNYLFYNDDYSGKSATSSSTKEDKNSKDRVLQSAIYGMELPAGSYFAIVDGFGSSNGNYNIEIDAAFANSLNPPENLTASVNEQDVTLNWDAPAGTGGLLHWDDGINNTSIGTNGVFNFDVVIRFEPADIANYDGMTLTQISFFPNEANCVYSLKVWQGGHAIAGQDTIPGTLLAEQLIDINDLTMADWNTIALDTPITIDATQELWFGYNADTQAGFPAGCDAGPAITGKGDLLYDAEDGWATLTGFGLDYNWNIQGLVESAPGKSVVIKLDKAQKENNNTRALTGYKLYRNNEEIATINDVTNLQYVDQGVEPGDYTYYVTAIYDEGESNPSNSVDVNVAVPVYNPPENLTVTVNNHNAVLQWEAPGTGGGAADVNEGFEAGVIPEDWTIIDADGDGNNWEIATDPVTAHTGDYCVLSASYINNFGPLTPDNYLITPQIQLGDNSVLNFWECAQDPNWAAEHYYVKVSTTGTDPADFTNIVHDETLVDGDWHEVSVDLSAFAGQEVYLAFEHCEVTDMYQIKLDDIAVQDASKGLLFSSNNNLSKNNSVIGFRKNTELSRLFAQTNINRQDRELTGYKVYRNGEMIHEIDNPGSLNYIDVNLEDGDYTYYVTAMYNDMESDPSNSVEINIVGNNDVNNNFETALSRNYPNPFNPETTISYSLKDNGFVSIEVYNILGQKVKTLVNENVAAGRHQVTWKGHDDNNKNVSSGIYFYRMKTGNYTSTKKMILMK